MRATDRDAGVQSIVRAFAILEFVARTPDGAGLSELSRHVGLHRSTTFNLARTMAALGYLDQSGDDRRYRIGRPLLCIAANAVDDLLLVNKAKAVIDELSRTSGETGTFAVWTGDQVVAMARSSGAGAFQLTERVGGSRPAHATATGKVLLAALQPGQLDGFLEHATLSRFTASTIVDARRLRREIADVRATGIAIDRAEYHDDVCCIAVAVRDFSGRTVGAMGLSGPVWRMTDDVRPAKAAMLRKSAERLSQELGHGGVSESYSPAMRRMTGKDAMPRKPPPRRTAAGKAPGKPAKTRPRRRTGAAASG